MPVDTNNLIQNVYDYFVSLYDHSKGGDPGNTFLSFEKIGHPVPPEDFKLPGQSGFSIELAIEHVSSLANCVPLLAGDSATDSAATVEDLYEMALIGSQPFSTTDPDFGFFTQLKSVAQKKFDELKVGALSGPYRFHPSYADPTDWYDTANQSNWVAHSFSVEKPAASPSKPPIAGGASAVWRVGPSSAHIATAVQRYPAIAARMSPSLREANTPSILVRLKGGPVRVSLYSSKLLHFSKQHSGNGGREAHETHCLLESRVPFRVKEPRFSFHVHGLKAPGLESSRDSGPIDMP
jgi:hypothetical protein